MTQCEQTKGVWTLLWGVTCGQNILFWKIWNIKYERIASKTLACFCRAGVCFWIYGYVVWPCLKRFLVPKDLSRVTAFIWVLTVNQFFYAREISVSCPCLLRGFHRLLSFMFYKWKSVCLVSKLIPLEPFKIASGSMSFFLITLAFYLRGAHTHLICFTSMFSSQMSFSSQVFICITKLFFIQTIPNTL